MIMKSIILFIYFRLKFHIRQKNLPQTCSTFRNFDLGGGKMEKLCDVILVTFFGE